MDSTTFPQLCYYVAVMFSTIIRRAAIFIAMLFGLAVIGGAFGFLAAIIGSLFLQEEAFGLDTIVGAAAGLILGYPLGVIIGVLVFEKVIHYRGWILMGVIGALSGGILPVAIRAAGIGNSTADRDRMGESGARRRRARVSLGQRLSPRLRQRR